MEERNLESKRHNTFTIKTNKKIQNVLQNEPIYKTL